MKYVCKIALIALLAVVSSCGGGGDDSPTPTPTPPEPMAAPKAATLVFPENNTECNEGVVIDDEKSRVTFRWNPSEDTDSYEVNIRNLNNNTTLTTTVPVEQAEIIIERGTPYEWLVVSLANGTDETASSSKFKFYNQGPGIENYAPFPAEVVNPKRGATIARTTNVNLQWTGSDIDEDIEEYRVLFGTETSPTEPLGTTVEPSLEATVVAGETYYWRVITADSQGNTSQSEIFEFRVAD